MFTYNFLLQKDNSTAIEDIFTFEYEDADLDPIDAIFAAIAKYASTEECNPMLDDLGGKMTIYDALMCIDDKYFIDSGLVPVRTNHKFTTMAPEFIVLQTKEYASNNAVSADEEMINNTPELIPEEVSEDTVDINCYYDDADLPEDSDIIEEPVAASGIITAVEQTNFIDDVNAAKGMPKVEIYTDGSCKGNPGPGGWGAILVCGNSIKELSGGDAYTTNNRMELSAVIESLSALKAPCEVILTSDSKYVVDAVEKGWVYKWRKNGWCNSSGDDTPNQDLWEMLLPLLERHKVSFKWVKGHAGHKFNERCDELAVAQSSKYEV